MAWRTGFLDSRLGVDEGLKRLDRRRRTGANETAVETREFLPPSPLNPVDLARSGDVAVVVAFDVGCTHKGLLRPTPGRCSLADGMRLY